MPLLPRKVTAGPLDVPAAKGGWFRRHIATRRFLFISVIAHLIFAAGASVYITQRIVTRRDTHFTASPPTTNPGTHEFLKDKPIAPVTMAVLRKVSGVRQIEIAELMVSTNNFTSSYAHALFIGTSPDHLLRPAKPKTAKGLSAGEIVRLQSEAESLERDFKASEAEFGENMLHLNSLGRYVHKLLANAKVARFLSTYHADLFEELEAVSKIESLG